MKFGWIIGSLILCAGGFVLSTLGIVITQADTLPLLLALWGLGAFVSAFAAARASTGSTIVEPAAGVLLFIVVVVGSFLATPFGDVFLSFAKTIPDARDEMLLLLAEIGGSFLVGGLLGAWVGEKIQSRSGDIGGLLAAVLAFLMVLGGVFFGVFVSALTMISGSTGDPAWIALVGIAVGSLVGGFAAGRGGAGAFTTLLGALGTSALLVMAAFTGGADSDAFLGVVIIAVGVVIISFIGGLVGRIGQHEPEPEPAKPARRA